MKRFFMTMCLAAIATSAALAQQTKTVSPPKRANDGTSLEVTMKFIQDNLNAVGPMNYVTYYRDNAAGDHWTDQSKDQVTNVVAYSTRCHITYHWKSVDNGKLIRDADQGFSLKDIEGVYVKPMEQGLNKAATAQGHPSWSVKVDPPIYVLELHRTDKGFNALPFFDERMANRVAEAMLHAVGLCGGGNKPKP
ncbi:MAG: hypothetical protein WB562_09925 [Candidatus Sulfotelmatobacter sp.]